MKCNWKRGEWVESGGGGEGGERCMDAGKKIRSEGAESHVISQVYMICRTYFCLGVDITTVSLLLLSILSMNVKLLIY